MGAPSGAGTASLSGVPEFSPFFQWGSYCSIFSLVCNACISFFLWSLCFLSFFDLRIMITPLLSSNFSHGPQSKIQPNKHNSLHRSWSRTPTIYVLEHIDFWISPEPNMNCGLWYCGGFTSSSSLFVFYSSTKHITHEKLFIKTTFWCLFWVTGYYYNV